jgi:hypothetical protein
MVTPALPGGLPEFDNSGSIVFPPPPAAPARGGEKLWLLSQGSSFSNKAEPKNGSALLLDFMASTAADGGATITS